MKFCSHSERDLAFAILLVQDLFAARAQVLGGTWTAQRGPAEWGNGPPRKMQQEFAGIVGSFGCLCVTPYIGA